MSPPTTPMPTKNPVSLCSIHRNNKCPPKSLKKLRRKSSLVSPTPIVYKEGSKTPCLICLLYTSDAADEEDSVDLGGRRIIKKKKKIEKWRGKMIYQYKKKQRK
eukprot:TRINITY_DN4093_c0_g1_i2.p1 TRINITY_DN4093_c0_g1~~TRINITY_DN4093_c0_g1_i2.p1  ORF type:complete len:104 (-),score=17.19 TRINITY_DN4093_c0_g1_i2:32-343(-)